MAERKSLLVEIGTEELPPKHLCALSTAFQQAMQAGLTKATLAFSDIEAFATPRRLALLIKDLESQQTEQTVEKKGPALNKAYDEQGQPSNALLGFMKSCGATIQTLEQSVSNKGTWIVYRSTSPGKSLAELLPNIIQHALKQLPIAKPMRWSNLEIQFIRPVHWITILYGTETIACSVLGKIASNITYGHRFHHPEAISLHQADDYPHALQQAYVIPSFEERLSLIKTQISDHANNINATPITPNDLLEEVTNIVEWPTAMAANFDKNLLAVPAEALISAMQNHQKCFALTDKNGQLLPHFIFISNIVSKQPQTVIAGNEKVMRARLEDAAFFFEMDEKIPLAQRLDALKRVVFHHKLGSVYDKTQRMIKLSAVLAKELNADKSLCTTATQLAKTDLVTDMVFEFPELQGIMGYYYAQKDQLPKEVAIAIRDHYLPRYAGDHLPSNLIACIVALTDRIDTLTALFAIGHPPTGDKDPFALRRAANGILRILIENELPLDLLTLSQSSLKILGHEQANIEIQLIDFYFERLRAWYQEQGTAPDTLAAVIAQRPTIPLDFAKRVQAVTHFRTLAEAPKLTAANKRVSNILKKQTVEIKSLVFESSLSEQEAERDLAQQLQVQADKIKPLQQQKAYTKLLSSLASLQTPIDRFFDEVMVMVDDVKLRNNRLALLQQLRALFLSVADLSLLQS